VAVGLGLRLDYAIRAPHAPVDDARAYARIAHTLYEGGGFSQGHDPRHRLLQPASDYAPGLPLLVAGTYEVRGAAERETARIVLALLSSLAIPLTFLLGRRLGGPSAGLIGAVPVAVQPALLEYTGMLMTEPSGSALLAGVILSFLWACEGSRPWPWVAAGALQGALAMLRPEYLLLIAVLPAVALVRLSGQVGPTRVRVAPVALMAACACLVLVPWTIRNLVVLDRLAPLTTGGGQILFQGSYIPAGPDPEDVTPMILERHPWIRRELAPRPGPIYRGQVVTLLAARRHPGEDPDTALARMGIDAYFDALTEKPLELAGFLAGKVRLAWTAPSRGVMRAPLWRCFHLALVLAALIGLIVGLVRRRFDVLAITVIILVVTVIQAIFIASPRRTLMLLPAISALAGLGVTGCAARAREALGR
jgi:hypothetical protein